MADRDSTFAGTWRRDTRPTTGRSATELRKRASFDQAPAEGMSCALALIVSLGMWVAIIAAILHTTGAIA